MIHPLKVYEVTIKDALQESCSLPEFSKELSKPRLHRHHKGNHCHTSQTRHTDPIPKESNYHQSLQRCHPQVVQIECNLQRQQLIVNTSMHKILEKTFGPVTKNVVTGL